MRVYADRGDSLVRVFASFRPAGTNAVPIVATQVRDLKVKGGRWRRVDLSLGKAGLGAPGGCKDGRIVVPSPVSIAGARRATVHLARDLVRDAKQLQARGSGHPQPVAFYPANPGRCDWIDGADCMFPWPNDFFTTADRTTDTGRRLNLNVLSMPRNVENKPIDPTPFNSASRRRFSARAPPDHDPGSRASRRRPKPW